MTNNSISKSPSPSQRQHSNLITRLWKNQPGKYFCIGMKCETGKWRDVFFNRDRLKDVPAFIERNNDKDLYACPHGFKEKHRQKPYAVPPKLLWADLDERDPRKIKIKPTIAIESSPGRYVGLWVVDRPVSEELNRRLNYFIGSDKSGWDLTQVLRLFPGTTNYKYDDEPEVKILWSDGPEYTIDELEKRIPAEASKDAGIEGDAAAVFKKYERKLPHWVRRELVGGKPVPGKRSEMLWKLEQTLIEKGLTTGEAFLLIKSSPWNKFAGRRDEDDQLKRELEKAVNHHFKASKPALDDDEDGPRFITAAELARMKFEPLKFVVDGYITEGLTLLAGKPKLGKSWLCLEIGLAVATGGKCLGGITCERGDVLYLALEDNNRRLKSRLRKMGTAAPDRLKFATEWKRSDEGGIDDISNWIKKNSNARLVIVDVLAMFRPISRDRSQTHYESDYMALKELQQIALQTGVAIVLVHHTRKGVEGTDPFEKVSGTLALSGAADTTLVLDRGSSGCTLYGRGREIAEIETAVDFDASTCRWVALGDAGVVRRTDERANILSALKEVNEPMSPKDIEYATGMKGANVRQLLVSMCKAGEVKKMSRGRYASQA